MKRKAHSWTIEEEVSLLKNFALYRARKISQRELRRRHYGRRMNALYTREGEILKRKGAAIGAVLKTAKMTNQHIELIEKLATDNGSCLFEFSVSPSSNGVLTVRV